MDKDVEPISRAEYEAFTKNYEIRHAELRLEIKEAETELKAQISTLSNKIDVLSTQISNHGSDVWKLVASSSVSLILGYLLSYVPHLLH